MCQYRSIADVGPARDCPDNLSCRTGAAPTLGVGSFPSSCSRRKRGLNMLQTEAESANVALRKRIEALSPWFHNLDLAGIHTAPDHFLGDYPAYKWRCIA